MSLKVVVIHNELLGQGVTKGYGFEGGSLMGNEEGTMKGTYRPLKALLDQPGLGGLLFGSEV